MGRSEQGPSEISCTDGSQRSQSPRRRDRARHATVVSKKKTDCAKHDHSTGQAWKRVHHACRATICPSGEKTKVVSSWENGAEALTQQMITETCFWRARANMYDAGVISGETMLYDVPAQYLTSLCTRLSRLNTPPGGHQHVPRERRVVQRR